MAMYWNVIINTLLMRSFFELFQILIELWT